jgi:hypothetical protein
LKENLARHSSDRDTLLALAIFNRESGNFAAALDYAERLAKIATRDTEVARIVEELKRQVK